MDIYFCDICNESVPAPDLDKGKAVRRKGRVVCASCEGAMSGLHDAPEVGEPSGPAMAMATGTQLGSPGAGPAAAHAGVPAAVPSKPTRGARLRTAPPSGAFLAGALSAVAMLFSVGVLLMLQERVERLEGESVLVAGGLRSEMESTARSFESEVDAVRAFALDEAEDMRAANVSLRAELQGGVADGAAAQRDLEESVRDLAGRFADVEQRLDEAARRGSSEARLQADIALLDAELRSIAQRLHALEEVGPAQVDEAVAAPPVWHGLLAELADGNAGVRWSAVQALGETGDTAVIPHLMPALDDADIFVRMAAARILGDLEAYVAVPALIETLRDEEPSVREAAAVTLRQLSGRDLRFDPSANDAERNRRIQAWEDWWERNQEELLAR